MHNALEPPTIQQDYEVRLRHQYHAYLVANVSVHDFGGNHQVEVGLNGIKYSAKASLEATRTAKNLTGLWRGTFYIRTKPDASLERSLNLRRVRPLSANQFNHQAAFWTCTGRVQRSDSRSVQDSTANTGLLEVVIELDQRGTSSFVLTVRVSNSLLANLGQSPFVHLTGTLEQNVLVATTLEPRDHIEALFP